MGIVQYCHVIPQGSHNKFDELRKRGLLSIDALNTFYNGISLCPNCHVLFDEHDFPGWVFLPEDLDYFLDFEQQDFERRQKHHNETREWSIRTVPSAQNYLQHQATLLPERAVGGLYRKLFFHSRDMVGEVAKFPPKPWHGCPLTALHRAFNCLGSQSHLFPDDIKQQLRKLQDLYGLHDQLTGVIPTVQPSSMERSVTRLASICHDLPQAPPSASLNTWNSHDSANLDTLRRSGQTNEKNNGKSNGHNPHPGRKRAHSEISDHSGACEAPETKRHASEKHLPWVWGPNATSEEKVDFYKGIYNIGKKHQSNEEFPEDDSLLKIDGYLGMSTQRGHTIEPKTKNEVEITELLPTPQASAG
ncbi:MAG: hypothetical protein Q9219_005537 [cf. Caloplaca sp. 3 TL-2023]